MDLDERLVLDLDGSPEGWEVQALLAGSDEGESECEITAAVGYLVVDVSRYRDTGVMRKRRVAQGGRAHCLCHALCF